MDVLTILGSPRKAGNTARVLEWAEEELGKDHTVERVNMAGYRVESWSDPPDTSDDANTILAKIIDADLVVFATPLYCWGFSARLKALFERSASFLDMKDPEKPVYLIEGKPMALVVTAEGPKENNMDLIGTVFTRYAEYFRARPISQLLVPNCRKPEDLPAEVEDEARKFARDLIAKV